MAEAKPSEREKRRERKGKEEKGRERKGKALICFPQPVCARSSPAPKDSFAVSFVLAASAVCTSLNTATEVLGGKKKLISSFLFLSYREGSARLQNLAGGSKRRCLYCFLAWCCLRSNRAGAPCARHQRRQKHLKLLRFFPPFSLNQRHFKFTQDLTKDNTPPCKSTPKSTAVLRCLPRQGLVFLRLENSLPCTECKIKISLNLTKKSHYLFGLAFYSGSR